MPLSLKQNDKGIYLIDGYALGQRVRTSTKTDSYAIALQKKAEIELAIAKGEYKSNTDLVSNASFKHVARKYLRSQNTGQSSTTLGYVGKLIEVFNSIPVKQIDFAMIEDYVDKHHTLKGNSNSTVRRELTQLQAILNYGAELGLRKSIKIKKPAEDDVEITVLSVDEQSRIFSKLDPDTLRVCTFLLRTGCRPIEARTLTYGQVNFEEQYISVGTYKGANGKMRLRKIVLHPEALAAIPTSTPMPSPDAMVFFVDGQPLINNRTLINDKWNAACKKAGVTGKTPYTLRHTFATRHCLNNVPPKVIADMMGHSDLKMIMRYMNTTVDDQRQYMVA